MAIEGVRDAAVFQPESTESRSIVRVAALVVAPTRTAREILDALATSVDSAFLPRPLVLVDALPRNELGKLPRDALMELLKSARRGYREEERRNHKEHKGRRSQWIDATSS